MSNDGYRTVAHWEWDQLVEEVESYKAALDAVAELPDLWRHDAEGPMGWIEGQEPPNIDEAVRRELMALARQLEEKISGSFGKKPNTWKIRPTVGYAGKG